MNDLRSKTSVFAFEHMLFQFSCSHNYIAKEVKNDDFEFDVRSIYDSKSYTVFHYTKYSKIPEDDDDITINLSD